MGSALVLLAVVFPPAVGILIGLSVMILSASCVVIAAPLAPRLIPAVLGVSVLAALLAQLG